MQKFLRQKRFAALALLMVGWASPFVNAQNLSDANQKTKAYEAAFQASLDALLAKGPANPTDLVTHSRVNLVANRDNLI